MIFPAELRLEILRNLSSDELRKLVKGSVLKEDASRVLYEERLWRIEIPQYIPTDIYGTHRDVEMECAGMKISLTSSRRTRLASRHARWIRTIRTLQLEITLSRPGGWGAGALITKIRKWVKIMEQLKHLNIVIRLKHPWRYGQGKKWKVKRDVEDDVELALSSLRHLGTRAKIHLQVRSSDSPPDGMHRDISWYSCDETFLQKWETILTKTYREGRTRNSIRRIHS
jgi:hypothetical protein